MHFKDKTGKVYVNILCVCLIEGDTEGSHQLLSFLRG